MSGLPKTTRGYDFIWVIVDHRTKSAYFLPVRVTYKLDKLAEIYVREIVRLHRVLKSIIFDRDSRFTSKFWKCLQNTLGTRLKFSITFYPQIDGQSKRTIQMLEDMLRAYALDFQGAWEKYLPLAEFSHNKNYHSTIGMAPYEARFERKYRSQIHCYETGEWKFLGLQLVE